jgi:hypothetical protein
MALPFLKNTRINIGPTIFFMLLFTPLWMYLGWYLTPKRQLVVAIVDKTVLSKKGQEHISLHWVLNHEKFTKNKKSLYKIDRDYFGFFPEKDKGFKLMGLERFNNDELNDLSRASDVAYIADAYGIYKNDWLKQGDDKEISKVIYGGLSKQDVYFLQQMKDKHKLVLAEFNCLGSPTDEHTRREFENTFGVFWSGWIGRYFDSFDTATNKEIPKWLVKNYIDQHEGKWPFWRSGIVFINADNKIVILENKTHLNNSLPFIQATSEGMNHYGLPEKIKYPFWFDIIHVDSSYNHVMAKFKLEVNANGAEILRENNIPIQFPAVTVHMASDYRFFYFSGDFCDNPIDLTSSYMKGISYFKWFLYNRSDPQERKSFFWTFYRPMVTTILNDYHKSLHH